jgi:hypothetical protein
VTLPALSEVGQYLQGEGPTAALTKAEKLNAVAFTGKEMFGRICLFMGNNKEPD